MELRFFAAMCSAKAWPYFLGFFTMKKCLPPPETFYQDRIPRALLKVIKSFCAYLLEILHSFQKSKVNVMFYYMPIIEYYV